MNKVVKKRSSPEISKSEDMEEFIVCQKCKEKIKRTSQDLLRHNEICAKGLNSAKAQNLLKTKNSPNQVIKSSAENNSSKGTTQSFGF